MLTDEICNYLLTAERSGIILLFMLSVYHLISSSFSKVFHSQFQLNFKSQIFKSMYTSTNYTCLLIFKKLKNFGTAKIFLNGSSIMSQNSENYCTIDLPQLKLRSKKSIRYSSGHQTHGV